MRAPQPTLLIDLGTASAGAVAVTEQGSWLVPDPANGESRWASAVHWDGQRMVAGAAAEQRRTSDPGGYGGHLLRSLTQDSHVMVGARRMRPVEQLAELIAAIRNQGMRQCGPLDRAVLTVPTGLPSTDPLRSQLVGAADAAGFTAVELLVAAAGAVWAPGSPLAIGDVALVFDLGATFEASVVRVGDDLPEIIGFSSIVDWPAEATGPAVIDLALACCRDLLARLSLNRTQVAWVVPVGGGARTTGLAAALDRGLGIPVARLEDPQLAVIRGAATWLPRSGPRSVMARPATERTVPLMFTLPGGSGQLLRWLVEPEQTYDAGTAVARVRLAGGAIWDLTARSRATLDQVLIGGGTAIASGEWLALVRPS